MQNGARGNCFVALTVCYIDILTGLPQDPTEPSTKESSAKESCASVGVTYIRWGKTTCPNITGVTLVYEGIKQQNCLICIMFLAINSSFLQGEKSTLWRILFSKCFLNPWFLRVPIIFTICLEIFNPPVLVFLHGTFL